MIVHTGNIDGSDPTADNMRLARSLVKDRDGGVLSMTYYSLQPKSDEEKAADRKYVEEETERMERTSKLAAKSIRLTPSPNALLAKNGALTEMGHAYWALRDMAPDDAVPFVGPRKAKALAAEAEKSSDKIKAWRDARFQKVLDEHGTLQAFFEYLQRDPYMKSLRPVEVTRRTKITFAEAKARQQKAIANSAITKKKMAYSGGIDALISQAEEDQNVIKAVMIDMFTDRMNDMDGMIEEIAAERGRLVAGMKGRQPR
jgi:hypothetical protein